jgi:hypothetical protein
MNRSGTLICSLILCAFSNVVHAVPIELVTNGGFETGTFANWTVSNTGNGGCGTNAWGVNSTGAHGCSGNVGSMPTPLAGSFAAYNTFDGPATTSYFISQLINVGSVSSASLSFLDTVRWNSFGGSDLQRTVSIDLFDAANTTLLSNLFSQSHGNVNQGWLAKGGDVTAQLAAVSNQAVTLRVSTIIPQPFTGPAGFGIDNISLLATPVPEPATLALISLGLAGLGFARQRRVNA